MDPRLASVANTAGIIPRKAAILFVDLTDCPRLQVRSEPDQRVSLQLQSQYLLGYQSKINVQVQITITGESLARSHQDHILHSTHKYIYSEHCYLINYVNEKKFVQISILDLNIGILC